MFENDLFFQIISVGCSSSSVALIRKASHDKRSWVFWLPHPGHEISYPRYGRSSLGPPRIHRTFPPVYY